MYLLSLIEMCQRFAFGGMALLLVLYLVQVHQFADAKATNLYGIFTGVAFSLPIVGGYLADKTSHKAGVIAGGLLTTLGCFLLATGSIHLLYFALLAATLGTALFTPSIYTILGAVYKDKHHLREAGFSIYYAAVNIGYFLAVFLLGTLGHMHAWGTAYVIAGLVQLVGIGIFLKLMRNKKFANLHATQNTASALKSGPPLKAKEKDRIIVISALSFISIFFWMAYNQGWSSMSLFTLNFTDKNVLGFQMPASWILSLPNLYLLLLAFPLAGLYSWLKKRKLDPSPPLKTAWSLVSLGVCFAIMMIGSSLIPAGAKTSAVSPLFPACSYFFLSLGEMLLAPIGLSLVTHLSPHRYTAFFVGMWYVCVGIGFYSAGLMAGLFSKLQQLDNFFLIFVLMTLIPAAALFFFSKKLNKMRHANSF
jgi:POT family proton-dependent oligopeptide transporter